MLWVALRMLIGDRVKYLGLVAGVAFATLLCVQQASIFEGVIRLTSSVVLSNPHIDVWVTRPGVVSTEEVEQMPESWLQRVRSVSGAAWAAPMYRGSATARTRDLRLRTIQVVGVDDHTLIGAPGAMVSGDLAALREPDAVVLDIATFKRLFPGLSIDERPAFELGKRRARVVGVCRSISSITVTDTAFARRSVAVSLAQEPNETVTFVLVRAAPGVDPADLARRIERQTGLSARTSAEYRGTIAQWALENTGIVEVLGTVMVLGLVVGVLVVGQTFYIFAHENQRFFATFKAMGASNARILGMLGLQALAVAALGYGIGVGGATLILMAGDTDLSPMRGIGLSPGVAAAVAALMPLIVLISAVFGARRVLSAEPGVVFKG